MENIDIKEISEKVKKLGAIGVNNFLNKLNNVSGDDGNETANEETLVDGHWEDSKEE